MAKWLEEKKDEGSFDSRIDPPADTPHFTLTLTLRLRFVPANPPQGRTTGRIADIDGNLAPVRRWTRAEWIHFRTEYRIQVHSTWDRAFVLTPPPSWDGFSWPERQGTKRKVLCTLQVPVRDEPGDEHVTITLVRVADGRPHAFRSDSFTYDYADILPKNAGGFGSTWTRYTTVHEFGHLLGLHHVNQRSHECRANPGSRICYGANLPDSLNVMGQGGVLDVANARPWTERIALHTKTSAGDWGVEFASDEASMRGI